MSKKGRVGELLVNSCLFVYPCGIMVKLWCGVPGG